MRPLHQALGDLVSNEIEASMNCCGRGSLLAMRHSGFVTVNQDVQDLGAQLLSYASLPPEGILCVEK
jgi:hypothetical protein